MVKVYIVNAWECDSEGVRVFYTVEAARQDCQDGRTYIERLILEKSVCSKCGK